MRARVWSRHSRTRQSLRRVYSCRLTEVRWQTASSLHNRLPDSHPVEVMFPLQCVAPTPRRRRACTVFRLIDLNTSRVFPTFLLRCVPTMETKNVPQARALHTCNTPLYELIHTDRFVCLISFDYIKFTN